MYSASRRPGLLSFGIDIAAYGIGIAFAAAVTTYAVSRVGTAVLQQLAPAAEAPGGRGAATAAPPARAVVSAPATALQSVRREATMTPLADRSSDRWDGRWAGASARPQPRGWGATASPFAVSARNPYRSSGEALFGSDDDEIRPAATFRTVCVRLCDGYFFPVSFVVTADRLEHDRGVCESRCGAQGRLFVHNNPGGSFDDLRDLAGRPYSQLRTAYLYRTKYVPSCTCQPQPWEQVSQDRHRVYALAVAVKKGNKDAAKELQALQAKVKEADKLAARPGPVPGEGTRPGPVAGSAKAAEIAAREDGAFMGLGGNGAPKAKTEPKPTSPSLTSRSDPDWMRRAFDR